MNDPQTNKAVKRKRPWLPITSVLIVVWLIAWLILAYAPIYPYSLTCRTYNYNWRSLEGPFSKVFVDGFTGGLHHYDANYLYYDGSLLLQFTGFGSKDDDLRNVEMKFIENLVDREWKAGEKKPPEHILKLAEKTRKTEFDNVRGDECNLMRAVALEGW